MKYTTLIGHVQSGKTHEEINFCYRSLSEKIPVLFITRNIISDQLQLQERIQSYSLSVTPSLNVTVLKHNTVEQAVAFFKSIGIIILLCNHHQLKKAVEMIDLYHGKYNVCIDEVDFSLKSKDHTTKIDRYLDYIKQNSNQVLGATATPFALFSSEPSITDIEYIKPGKNYRGIQALTLKFVTPNISLSVHSDALAINDVYTSLLEKESCVLLHTVSKKKEIHKSLLRYIPALWNSFTVLTYNGDGIQLICKKRNTIPFAKAKTSNQYGQVILKYFYLNGIHHFQNWSIAEVLQLLVDDPHYKHTHISIISGHLASRGISFVSSDYSLHLTDQYFHPGKNTHGENYIQSLRILGCYSDTKPLTLWCTDKTWKCILQHHKLITDAVTNVIKSSDWITKIQEINLEKPDTPLCRHQFSGGSMFIKKKNSYYFKIKGNS